MCIIKLTGKTDAGQTFIRGETPMDEIMDLYTVDRLPTGKTAKRDEPHEEGLYRMTVHVCLFNENGDMLIQKRSDQKERWPGYWDFSAGGGALSGETCRDAAERETFEELGVHLDMSKHRPVITINFGGGFDDFFAIDTKLTLDDLALPNEEVAYAKWAGIAEIEELIEKRLFLPYEKSLIGYLFNVREGKGLWNL